VEESSVPPGTPATLVDVQDVVAVPVQVLPHKVGKVCGCEAQPEFELLSGGFVFEGINYAWEDVVKICRELKVLYFFSGPRRAGDFGAACKALQAVAVLVDTELDEPGMDLLDESNFERYMAMVRNREFDAALMAMPCSTFSGGRIVGDGGPPPLRGCSERDIYGLPNLSLADKEKVRIGTVLALRGAALAKECNAMGIPWLAETPRQVEDKPSVLKLPEWRDIYQLQTTRKRCMVQCACGAESVKATELWGTTQVEDLPAACQHPARSWTVPWSGEAYWAPHPRLKGTQLAIPSEDWDPDMLLPRMPGGSFVSKAAALYPPMLNHEIAFRLLMKAGLDRHGAAMFRRQGFWANSLVRVPEVRPTGQQLSGDGAAKDLELQVSLANRPRLHSVKVVSPPHIGDLRNISKSVVGIPGHLIIGKRVRLLLDQFLDRHPEIQRQCLDSVGCDVADQFEVVDDVALGGLRQQVCRIFSDAGIPVDPEAARPCDSGLIASNVCGLLLHAWARAAGDPAASIALWFRDGAPAGVKVPLDELEGIMPKVQEDDIPEDPESLSTDYGTFTNHGDLDEDAEVVSTFADLVSKRYLHQCDSLEECQAFLGGQLPILNKFACIIKHKWVEDKRLWKVKRRIIMDSKRSGVKDASVLKYKSVLPRITDAIGSLMGKLDAASKKDQVSGDVQVEQFVIDATDAFWELGLRPEERRFFVGKLGDKFLVYLRTAQGSRGAPLSWAAVFGLICRCVQSLFFVGSKAAPHSFEADMQVYVDDPWVAAIGDKVARDRIVALLILAWRIIGVKLAFGKARRGQKVDWIGACMHIVDRGTVRAAIMKDRVDEIRHLTEVIAESNVVSIKELRSYTGKLQSMASLLHTWRPFVGMLWAALYQPPAHSQAPPGCIWSVQIREPISWFQSFWRNGENQNIVRDFCVEAHFNRGKYILICVDASPYGLGAWISIDGVPTHYFCDKVSDLDCQMLLIEANVGSAGQQAFEALALLVAVRLWLPDFRNQRVSVCLRGDNMAALHTVAKMQPKSKSLGVVARELALDLACASYSVDFVQHLAGVTNVTADILSRKFQPGKTFEVPFMLERALEVEPPVRDASWWRTKPAS